MCSSDLTCRHGVGQYGSLHVYPEYRLPIGHPVGRAVEQGGIWRRNYSNGVALVNPGDSPTSVVLDGVYADDRGRAVVSPVTIPPKGGVVLIRNLASGR